MTDFVTQAYFYLQKSGLYGGFGTIVAGICVLVCAYSYSQKNFTRTWVFLIITIAWGIGWATTHQRNQWLDQAVPPVPGAYVRFHAYMNDREHWEFKVDQSMSPDDVIKIYRDNPIAGWSLLQSGDGPDGVYTVLKKNQNILKISATPDTSYLRNQGPNLTYELFTPEAFDQTSWGKSIKTAARY